MQNLNFQPIAISKNNTKQIVTTFLLVAAIVLYSESVFAEMGVEEIGTKVHALSDWAINFLNRKVRIFMTIGIGIFAFVQMMMGQMNFIRGTLFGTGIIGINSLPLLLGD